ncbi:MAG: cytochrome c-type biogenesis protein [Thermodesulfobacteriota bacterium]
MKRTTFLLLTASSALIALLLSITPLYGATNTEKIDTELMKIASQLMCPVCRGQSVAESNSELATNMRSVIRTKLEAGQSREQIKQYFIDRYGDSILGAPPARGANLLLWFLPAALVLIGGILIGAKIYHTRGEPGTGAEEGAEKHGVEGESDYVSKLKKDLDDYDS